MKDSGITDELLTKYISGKCDEDEVEFVEKWYASLGDTSVASEFNQRVHLSKIKKVIELVERRSQKGKNSVQHPRSVIIRELVFRYVAAAVFLVVLGMGFYLVKYGSETVDAPFVGQVRVSNEAVRVLRRTLPDGSQVWLNPGATLVYPSDFGNGDRIVEINGEVFFDVVRDESHPFVVRSGKMVTRVLGTSFNIKANRNEKNFEVAVVTGKVEVSALDRLGKDQKVMLSPREKVTYSVEEGNLISHKLSEKQTVNETWQPVSLTFEDDKLDEVVKRLERKFGINVILENPGLKNCKLRAVFEQQRLAEILDMTTQMLEATYEMKAGEIIIKGDGCAE